MNAERWLPLLRGEGGVRGSEVGGTTVVKPER